MIVLVKCPKCGLEFQDDDEVFHLENGCGDENIVSCDCGAVFSLELEAKLREVEEDV